MASRTGEGGGIRAGLTLFGEVVITGVLVAVLAAPLVTAVPALVAGTAHLRRQLTGDSVRLADAWADFTAAWRTLWPLALAFPFAVLLLLWNLSLAETGLLPGGPAVYALSLVHGGALAVLLLRIAARWHPGTHLGTAVRAAFTDIRDDLSGSLLLVLAAAMCLVFVWMLLPLALLVGGLLALAALGVEHRFAARTAAGAETGEPEGSAAVR
ncbi:hypothetical protein N0X72_06130 [Streptomyces carpaticus]|uniref:hypothetical protein n=1 Tax=Streptomyces carpaticus TaxID=285558 RepID=UPI002205D31F|nr:hypothetical protein N0X72_06130 [Streptomyces carpaticus]